MERKYIEKYPVTVPRAITGSILITGVVNSKQVRHVITSDVPNSLLQESIPKSEWAHHNENLWSLSAYTPKNLFLVVQTVHSIQK